MEEINVGSRDVRLLEEGRSGKGRRILLDFLSFIWCSQKKMLLKIYTCICGFIL